LGSVSFSNMFMEHFFVVHFSGRIWLDHGSTLPLKLT
jgi:hypothetical protein